MKFVSEKAQKPSWLQWDDEELFGRSDDYWHTHWDAFRGREYFWLTQDDDGSATGPSTLQSPYLVSLNERVNFTSILTTGDAVNDADIPGSDKAYRMAGIPDGIGAFDNKDGTFTLLMNHEIAAGLGVVRDHGGAGAFVTKLVIDKDTLQVVSGDDLIEQVLVYDTTTKDYRAGVGSELEISRLCSGDLPDQSAFFHDVRHGPDLGYEGRIFLSGEEDAGKGRAFAHVVTGIDAGKSYELAWMGNQQWENLLANEFTGKKTVVIGLDDTSGQPNNQVGVGELYVYVGEKQATGNAVEKAGLIGGMLYGIKVDGVIDESRFDGIDKGTNATDGDIDRGKASFSLVALGGNPDLAGDGDGDVSQWGYEQLENDGNKEQVTNFLRPEDGAWDPTNPNVFYFVTTDRFNAEQAYGAPVQDEDGQSRLYKLTFKDVDDPTKGGQIEMLLDGNDGPVMMDNITVNSHGQVLIQEDPGGRPYSAKIWLYDPHLDTREAGSSTGNTGLTLLAQSDPDRFDPNANVGGEPFLTQDEESSGIVDVSDIFGTRGEDVYLLGLQAHYQTGDLQTVEGGQLLAMTLETNNGHHHQGNWLLS